MFSGRPDEGDAVGFQDVGELCVLRQKTVARMHRLGAGDFAGGDDLVDVEVAWAGPIQRLSSESRTCMASASAVECTATQGMPSSLQARSTRRAISPRLAM